MWKKQNPFANVTFLSFTATTPVATTPVTRYTTVAVTTAGEMPNLKLTFKSSYFL